MKTANSPKKVSQDSNKNADNAIAVEVERLKSEGNAFYVAKNYQEAEATYSKAIELNPKIYTLYGNRSAARIHLGRNEEGLADATKAVELCNTWSKGYYRQGAAYAALKEYRKAQHSYMTSLKYDEKTKCLPDLIRQMKILADRHDKTVTITGREQWKDIFSNISDVRVRLCTFVYFWNKSTPKERYAIFSRFLQVLGAQAGRASEYSENEMLRLPADNYEDVTLPTTWYDYYDNLDLPKRIEAFNDMYDVTSEQEKTMIVNDMKTFLLHHRPNVVESTTNPPNPATT